MPRRYPDNERVQFLRLLLSVECAAMQRDLQFEGAEAEGYGLRRRSSIRIRIGTVEAVENRVQLAHECENSC